MKKVLFIGGPWDGRIETMEAKFDINIPTYPEYGQVVYRRWKWSLDGQEWYIYYIETMTPIQVIEKLLNCYIHGIKVLKKLANVIEEYNPLKDDIDEVVVECGRTEKEKELQ